VTRKGKVGVEKGNRKKKRGGNGDMKEIRSCYEY